MSNLIGRMASFTFSGVTTPTNGQLIAYKFGRHVSYDGTLFGDLTDRPGLGTGYGSATIEVLHDSAATPALTELLTGTGAVLTIFLNAAGTRKYTITNAMLIDMEGRATSTNGSPGQKSVYSFIITNVTADNLTQAIVAT